MQPPTGHEAGPWPHTGVVLAGGASRRMGRPKHDLTLPDGTTMLEAVAGALGAVCAQVIVAGDVETGLRRVADLRPDQGPLGGLEAILASGLDAQYLVCPCDVPLVTPSLLARLTAPSERPATVYRVEGEPDFWPLPARIAAEALEVARSRLDRGERAVHDFMRALRPEVVAVLKDDAGLLANVNTPEDYERLRPG
ncbi:MAG: molybdenum cofactor guanylyltransferase [Planctomycetota bacterium]